MIETELIRANYQVVYAHLVKGLSDSQVIILNSLLDMARELEVLEECND